MVWADFFTVLAHTAWGWDWWGVTGEQQCENGSGAGRGRTYGERGRIARDAPTRPRFQQSVPATTTGPPSSLVAR